MKMQRGEYKINVRKTPHKVGKLWCHYQHKAKSQVKLTALLAVRA